MTAEPGNLEIRQLMTSDVATLSPDDSLRVAYSLLRANRIRHIPIVSEGLLVGILSDRDVKRALPSLLVGITEDAHDELLESTVVARIMTRDPVTVSPSTPAGEALAILIDRKYGALPVVEQGRLVGIVTATDFLRWLQRLIQ